MKNESKENPGKKVRMSFILGFAASFLGSIAAVYFHILPERIDNNIKKTTAEAVITTLEKITIPSNILFHEEIKECIDEPGPIEDGYNSHGDKIVNLKKILRKCIKLEKKTLLRIEAIAGSTIDRMKLSTYKAVIGRHSQHRQESIGFMETRIFIDEIERAGDSKTAINSLQTGLYSSCPCSILLEPETYKIQVEVIYYGCLANPRARVKLTGELAEPINLKDLLKPFLEKEKRRVFLDIKSKEKSQTFESHKTVGIQPAVAGPAVTCKYEAQKANKEKQSASHGEKCPEAVTGQR
jgi:hypothetical protein